MSIIVWARPLRRRRGVGGVVPKPLSKAVALGRLFQVGRMNIG
jgi:hypothetical protein